MDYFCDLANPLSFTLFSCSEGRLLGALQSHTEGSLACSAESLPFCDLFILLCIVPQSLMSQEPALE